MREEGHNPEAPAVAAVHVGGARGEGGDPRAMLRAILEKKRTSDNRVCGLAFAFWLLSTVVLLAAIGALIFQQDAENVPIIAELVHLNSNTLQWIATACAILSSALFMNYMKLRQEQTKHTFLLVLVMEGSVKEAATLLFGDQHKTGMLDAAAEVIGALQ
ncbi:MAG: hypothetical protein R3C52_00890 [Hyphomonadaceae bacterium]